MPRLRLLKTAAACWGALAVHAVEVGPEAFAFRVNPGATATATLSIRNDTDAPLKAGVSVEGNDAEWLAVSAREVRLAPGKRKTLRVRARPSKIDRGERTAMVVVTVPGPEDSQIRVLRRVTLVIAGTELATARVTSTVARRTDTEVRVRAAFQNTGNVTLRLKAAAELFFTNGRRLRSPPTDLVVLPPGASRSVEMPVPVEGPAWGGRGRVRVYFLDGHGRTTTQDHEFGPEVLAR